MVERSQFSASCMQKCNEEIGRVITPDMPYNEVNRRYAECIEKCKSQSEMSDLHKKVCSYLRNKIADEERESANYQKLESDLRKLTNGHAFLDMLLSAQANEIEALKGTYRDFCVPGQR